MFPPSLLAKLIVPGSLKNNEDGFEFTLKNIIDSGTITGIGALTIGERIYEPARIVIRFREKEIPGDQVSRENPIYARSMLQIQFCVRGEPLAAGEYKIVLPVQTLEAGRLQIVFTEPLSQ